MIPVRLTFTKSSGGSVLRTVIKPGGAVAYKLFKPEYDVTWNYIRKRHVLIHALTEAGGTISSIDLHNDTALTPERAHIGTVETSLRTASGPFRINAERAVGDIDAMIWDYLEARP